MDILRLTWQLDIHWVFEEAIKQRRLREAQREVLAIDKFGSPQHIKWYSIHATDHLEDRVLGIMTFGG